MKLAISKVPARVASFRRALVKAERPEQVININAAIAGLEEMMRQSGFYRTEEIRPVREVHLDARCELGGMLRKVMRAPRGANARKTKERSVPSFLAELKRLQLAKPRAIEYQRASFLPAKERQKVYAEAKRQEILPTMDRIIEEATPYWYKERRKDRHRKIAARAKEAVIPDKLGPFPLIYADPPWSFETFAPGGHKSSRMAENHYPVLSDAEIASFKIGKQSVRDLAAEDATLFLWCTSSNILRAIDVMISWEFIYKTHAVWDKMRMGTGFIFHNQHELLLVGTRGAPPKPIEIVPSVLRFPRTKHSAKPMYFRQAIERMYPFFDTPQTKIEMFARSQLEGWTCVGFEAN